MLTSIPYFRYRDTPGVNAPLAFTLPLYQNTGAPPINQTYTFNNATDPSNGVPQQEFWPADYVGAYYNREKFNIGDGSADPYHNFWFTTEFHIEFMNYGNLTFNFTGDDDLWVFINGTLTTCDLGSIHSKLSCSIFLDKLNLTLNETYNMDVFHAERHTTGSNLAITTSILPLDHAPVAQNFTVSLKSNEDKNFTFTGAGYDQDSADQGNLEYFFTSVTNATLLNGTAAVLPANGTIWYNGTELTPATLDQYAFSASSILTYVPNTDFYGTDMFFFVVFDGQLYSSIGNCTFIVQQQDQPPVANNYTLNLFAGNNTSLQLTAEDPDNSQAQLSFYLLQNSNYGNANLTLSGLFTFQVSISSSMLVYFAI